MADVKALGMDVVTEKSGHSIVGMAVSVCITPAAPAPLPMPYPLTGSVGEGIADSPLRTKVCGTNAATIGSVAKACHGNEPGTLKEVVSLNTGGPCAPLTGAFTVICELGPFAITGSMGMANKGITVGMGSNAGDAGGDASGSGAGGASGSGGDPTGPQKPSQSGSGSGSSGDGASGGGGGGPAGDGNAGHNDPSKPDKRARPGATSGADGDHQCQGGHPVDLVTGAVVDEATDLEIAGLIPMVFKRYYSSLRHRDDQATLGPGWAHGFEQRIETLDTTCALRDGQGRWLYFEKIAVGESTFHRGERLTLTRVDERTHHVYAHDTRWTSVFSPVKAEGAAVLRRIEDPYGNAIVFEHRGEKLARVVDTAGRSVNVAWQGRRIAGLSVAGGGVGAVVSYDYDRQGRLRSVTDPLGHAESFEYDRLGRMVATTTRSGPTFAYEYEEATPHCKATYGPDGLFETHLTRDAQKRVTVTDGEEPRVVAWNDKGLAERLLLPDGTRLDEAAYDDDGLLIAKANGAGEGWQYWYDALGRRVRALDPCERVTGYEYEGEHLARVIGPDGNVTRFSHDTRGALTAVEYPWGEQYSLRYDARGRLIEVTGNAGRVALYEYDADHNVIAETDARGARTTYRYDGFGRAVAMRDALGRETRVRYDARGQRTSITLPDGATTTFAYDAAGHLTRVVDALGRVTRYGYSGLHALSRVVGPDGATWRIGHTREERVRCITNPLGEEYRFERDLAGRVVAEKTFDGRELRYELDGAGRVARTVYADGDARIFGYDKAGRLLRDATREEARTFARDSSGRLLAAVVEGSGYRHETRFDRDGFGRLVGESQGDRRIRYELDAFGRRTQRVLPNGVTTRYAYSASGDLTGVDHDGFALAFERDALGRETVRSHRAGLRVDSRHDDDDRLIEQRATAPGADGSAPRVLVDRRYHYDRIGRVERVDDGRWGATTYTYDALDQLLGAKRGTRAETFAYDLAGSIVAVLEHFDGARREAKHEVGPGNVVLRAGDTKFAYDKRGRRIRKAKLTGPDTAETTEYAWDGWDQLRAATLPDGTRVALEYDAIGRRVRKQLTSSGEARIKGVDYVWDSGVLAMQVDSVEGLRAFVHAPGTFVPLLQQEHGEVFACVVDQVGTAKELVTADGLVAWSAAHSAWGAVVAESAEEARGARRAGGVRSPFRLLGQIADEELGLCFTRHRMFDSELGRWLTPDSLGIRGGRNVFAFDGAPSLVVDPFGLSTNSAGGGGGGSGKPHNPLAGASDAEIDAAVSAPGSSALMIEAPAPNNSQSTIKGGAMMVNTHTVPSTSSAPGATGDVQTVIKVHSADSTAKPGSNSATGNTVSITQGKGNRRWVPGKGWVPTPGASDDDMNDSHIPIHRE